MDGHNLQGFEFSALSTRHLFEEGDIRHMTCVLYGLESPNRRQLGGGLIEDLGRGFRTYSTHILILYQPTCEQVLGPFPIQAREQIFLSPSFPLNCALVLSLSFM